ncbi:hypothetical protein KBY58_12145 [Cyanobium sp. HWJ4-Hawea]|uniref:hypothetical protein n=1 Tax=Cyanobium sp. HWJ4-Hawea TaxID=2823713 RepID=UPI0020CC7E73|nr:hypothetical protein [Cyanobium sp. HWJ4-Hawea]MCP9810182.1 hypothetical protein [Cyanobium sp. HWJ4-Hawea]
MSGTLSERYLLYLRDMSKKVVFGSGAAGDYSQVLMTTTRKKSLKKFQRITDLRLNQVIESGAEGYRRELDQEKIGNGIFCGVGILAGTYSKKVGSKSTLRLIAAPTIYGQIVFEESGEAEVTEWVVNYDIATALIGRNADEEEEAYAAFDPEASQTGGQIVQDIEDQLDALNTKEIGSILGLSEKYVSGFKELTETTCERGDTPLECVEAAIDARDNLKTKKFFFCPGDWVFFAPVPPGLSTYRALDELAKEVV